jgi:membrane protein DedA with SNARE-associated domain
MLSCFNFSGYSRSFRNIIGYWFGAVVIYTIKKTFWFKKNIVQSKKDFFEKHGG